MNVLQDRFIRLERILGRPVARRFPLSYMPILAQVLYGPRPMTAMSVTRTLRAPYDDVATVLRTMKRSGWITLVPNPLDRRAKHLVLTAKGEAMRDQLDEFLKEDQS